MAKSKIFWLLYIGVILIPTVHFNTVVAFILWLVLLVTAYVQRKKAININDTLCIAHATWAIRTYWISFLLPLAIVAVAMVIVGMSDYSLLESQVGNSFNEWKEGIIGFPELFSRLWEIDTLRNVFYVIFAGLVLMIWPVKRAVQGILALTRNLEPAILSNRQRIIALVLAVIILIFLGSLASFVSPKML